MFYGRTLPQTHPEAHNKQWMLTGDIDKPVYIVGKVHKVDDLAQHPDIVEIGRKNGFVFFRREAVLPKQ